MTLDQAIEKYISLTETRRRDDEERNLIHSYNEAKAQGKFGNSYDSYNAALIYKAHKKLEEYRNKRSSKDENDLNTAKTIIKEHLEILDGKSICYIAHPHDSRVPYYFILKDGEIVHSHNEP